MSTPDSILDAPDANEPWCTYETACISCGKRQMHVATLHAYEYGYVEPTPLCQECIDGAMDIRDFARQEGIDLDEEDA